MVIFLTPTISRNLSCCHRRFDIGLGYSGGSDEQSSLDIPKTDSDYCHRLGTQTSLSKCDTRYHPRVPAGRTVNRVTVDFVVVPHRNRRTCHVYTGWSTIRL